MNGLSAGDAVVRIFR